MSHSIFFFNVTSTTDIYTLSLHDALPISKWELAMPALVLVAMFSGLATAVEAAALTALYALVVQAFIHRDVSLRSEEHTSELQSRRDLVCRLLLEKKKNDA